MKKELLAVDLFSGAGGLTLGLKKAGFKVVAAIEIDKAASETYKANHPEVELFVKDIKQVSGEEILKAIGNKKIDLIAGCPPCQGFSKLTDKYKRDDPRNVLAFEMVRLIEEIKPRMVMMENVPGLAMRGKVVLEEFVSRLVQHDYVINKGVLQLADYGIPQSRKRLVLLAGKGFEINLPKKTHTYKNGKGAGLKKWKTLHDALKKMKNNEVVTLSEAVKKGGPQKFNWNVIRDMTSVNLERLKSLKQGFDRTKLPKELRPKCHANSNHGFQNVYGRMDWNQTPPTITGGCTTLSKGRFGHPNEMRTITVREAAIIQTFPKYYKIQTDYMEHACTMIGNALPPKFAEIAGKACIEAYLKEF